MAGDDRRWLSFSEIAEKEGTSKRWVQDVVDLAMLVPDALDAIDSGEQTDGLTMDYLIKSGFPVIWSYHHKRFSAL